MVADVVAAIAVETAAARAIAKFKLWVRAVSSAADSAAMRVIRHRLFGRTEGDRAALRLVRLFSFCFYSQRKGEKICDVFSHKKQIISECHQREEVVGEIQDRITEVEYFC